MTGALNVIYINRSVTECIEAASTAASTAATCPHIEADSGVCDLKADRTTLVLLLSAITVRSRG